MKVKHGCQGNRVCCVFASNAGSDDHMGQALVGDDIMHDNEKKAFDEMWRKISEFEERIKKMEGMLKIDTQITIKRREELQRLSMGELRKIGDPLGAKDTKKSELIEEIIQKKLI